MSSQRVADYFIIAGLPENPVLLEDAHDSQLKATSKNEPITDICVIIPNEGEECPPGYKPLLETPTGLIADLNHGSIRSPEIFICCRRGRDKSPLTDIGVLYEGSERVLPGCEVVYTTPYGRPANLNNTASRIYLTYRRAQETASSDTLAVTDVCVIITSKGEKAPHSFCKIDKNLNQSMMSSSVYLCYKKSMCKDYSLAYKPGVLGRYPAWDWPDFPLPEDSVAMFGLPMGAMLESWPDKAAQAKPVFSTFVLTGLDGKKVYGAAVTFYELYKNMDSLAEPQRRTLGLHMKKPRLVHSNKAICLLAKRPFFDAFKSFLQFLYRQTLNNEPSSIPIERLISHFMWEVPFPTPQRPRVLVPLSAKCEVQINLPDESPIPLSGASFSSMLKNLAVENTISLLTMTLLERKILIHSLRPAVLTCVIEAVGSMLFPFSWQCPYIPLCPLGLADVLFAPVPYIVGVDSRYFDLYDPPPDVTCIDLDTNTISKPSDNKLLPKRPTKVLKATLEKLYLHQIELRQQSLKQQKNSQHQQPETDPKILAAENAIETGIQEAFLRFMAALLKGYKSFLLPITAAPNHQSTSVKELFDLKGFLKSRDKAYHKLYDQVVRTQAFTRFIEERSFNIRDDTSLLFFDECTEKVDENYDTPRLLETDPYKSEHTVFVSPPQPDDVTKLYKYDSFPSKLNHELFPHRDPPPAQPEGDNNQVSADLKPFIAKRNNAEIKAALKFASMSKKGIAASTLWSKCLVSNAFSLWFIHLPSFIQVSQSPQYCTRTACEILKKMQQYRLHTPDEMCFRTMMQLCCIYQLPVIAVKVLCEMRSIGLNANAVTYGYYNKAVLESKWPSESSNAQVLWRKIRHVLNGLSQFRRPIKRRRHLIDFDSVSRGSEDSGEADSSTRKEDGLSNASDRGYSSMSQEDIHRFSGAGKMSAKGSGDAFRAKVGSIIKRSVNSNETHGHNVTGAHLESSAGLLITARRIVHKVPLGVSLNVASQAAFAEAKRKRHRSAGDHLKVPGRLSSDLGCEPLEEVDSSQQSEDNSSTPTNKDNLDTNSLIELDEPSQDKLLASDGNLIDIDNVFDPLTSATITNNTEHQSQKNNGAAENAMKDSTDSLKPEPVVSDDPLGLFSAQSPEITRSTPKNKDIDLLSNGTSTPPVTTMDIGNLFGRESPKKTQSTALSKGVKKYNLLELSPENEGLPQLPTAQLRKSVSLDSRNSYKAALKDEDSKSADAVLSGPSADELAKKRDSLDSKESLDSVESGNMPIQEVSNQTPSYKDWVTASLKRSTSLALTKNLSTKVKSIVYGPGEKPKPQQVTNYNALSSHESIDSIGVTPPIKRNTGMTGSIRKIKSVSSSMASKMYSSYNKIKHTVKEYQAPSTVSTPYKDDKTTENNDDNISILSSHSGLGVPGEDNMNTVDDGNKPFDTNITYESVSAVFINRYLASTMPTATSTAAPQDTLDGSATSSPIVEVILCTATLCEHCSVILYDEDIMSGWSAQDSDLNTVCRFCERKQVPFLTVNMKDLRAQSKRGSRIDDPISSPPLTPRSEQSPGIDPLRVPYLSPLVLRKELEHVLDSEGDVALTSSDFVDSHAIIYWNLLWFFKRMNVPSHLPQLIFGSQALSLSDLPSSELLPAHVLIRAVWDNPKLHDAMVSPMYKQWAETGVKSSVVRALLTDDKVKSKGFMQQILTYVECNDMYTPLRQILNNRRLQAAKSTVKCHSAYRDILFLAFTYFGRDIMDHDAFDREYKLAFKRLSLTDRQYLHVTDFPPTPTVMWCRKLFGNLEIV